MNPTYRRIDPFRDLLQIQDSFARAFEASDLPRVVHTHGEHSMVSGAWQPLVDVYEDAEHIVLKVELPEVSEKEIEVLVEGNALTVRGERTLQHADERQGYRLIERTYGSFLRSFTLPDTVDSAHLTAEYIGGVLSIRLPKRPESKPRQIKVAVEVGRLAAPAGEKQ